jgi:hypothetical protein
MIFFHFPNLIIGFFSFKVSRQRSVTSVEYLRWSLSAGGSLLGKFDSQRTITGPKNGISAMKLNALLKNG